MNVTHQRNPVLLCTSKQVKTLTRQLHMTYSEQSGVKVPPANDLKKNQQIDLETQREVNHHGSFANDWWNINGTMKALHSLNAIR